MPDGSKHTATPVTSPAAKKQRLSGWPLVLLIVLLAAGVGRGVLALLSLTAHHHTAGPAPMPSLPFKAGDVFTLRPGDPVIAKWAESPDSNGFIVQAIELNGKPVKDAKVCALEPDYMADPAQPGGTLTLVSQDGAGDWRVHWQGGDTLPETPPDSNPSPDATQPQRNANCGKDALFMMSQAQLHSWLDMQNGVATERNTDTLEPQPVLPANP